MHSMPPKPDDALHSRTPQRPLVWFVGEPDHGEFRYVVDLVRQNANLVAATSAMMEAKTPATHERLPNLLIFAQARPGQLSEQHVERLRRNFPLAGVVSLLGSWCEGQTRTGRPLPGAVQLYWHEFPPWWLRQTTLLALGRCPDWARPGNLNRAELPGTAGKFSGTTPVLHIEAPAPVVRAAKQSLSRSRHPFSEKLVDSTSVQPPTVGQRGLVVLGANCWETANALADLLHVEGYSSVWQTPGRHATEIRGAVAGIWDGGQLDDVEAIQLAEFCRRLARDSAPVVALLDFPRCDSFERACALGARIAIGKPWHNHELLALLQSIVTPLTRKLPRDGQSPAA